MKTLEWVDWTVSIEQGEINIYIILILVNDLLTQHPQLQLLRFYQLTWLLQTRELKAINIGLFTAIAGVPWELCNDVKERNKVWVNHLSTFQG